MQEKGEKGYKKIILGSKVDITVLTIFLCIFKNFLCIIEMAGAMWIKGLLGRSLCFSIVLWPGTFLGWGKF